MSKNALENITYGLYILSSKHGDDASGCIIDACIQAGIEPDRIAISVMKNNYTRKLIKKSGVFSLAILEEDCPFELIKHFGFQSGRDVDKFKGLTTFVGINGVPCILSNVCSTICAKVVDRIELGSHTIFIGEVIEQKHLSDVKPLTYAHYQTNIKPRSEEVDQSDSTEKSEDHPSIYDSNAESHSNNGSTSCSTDSEKKVVGWRCNKCGFVYGDSVLPDDYTCPVCGNPCGDFAEVY